MSDEEVLRIIAGLPRMTIQLVFSLLRFKRAAVRAEKLFYQTLIENGLSKREARKLAEIYASPTSLRSWIRMNK
ncbi:MAG: hypothetical protein WCK39_06690 [Methanomassiliicoccales archaeon]